MASEQARREKTRSEREIPVEKDRVPKMTIHFESLARETPQEGAEDRDQGKARETHEEESQFESLADKVKTEKEEREEGREKVSYAVGKFEVNFEGERGAGEAKGREGHEQGGEGRKEKTQQERGGTEIRSKELEAPQIGEGKEVRSKVY